MVLSLCLRYWFRRYGEPFWANGQTRCGIFTQPPGDLLRWLFSAEELSTLPRPLWMLAHLPDTLLLPGDTVLWKGEVYTALRYLEFRLGNTLLYRITIIQHS